MSKITYISEEQEKFLKENKGLLFEYYIQASNPKYDNNILGNVQIWVYGNDRQDFTPNCHIMVADKSIEFEVSIIDWTIVNVKRPNNISCDWGSFRKIGKVFFKWLESKNKLGVKNKKYLYSLWDGSNPNNTLEDFIKSNNLKILDEDLIKYITDEE